MVGNLLHLRLKASFCDELYVCDVPYSVVSVARLLQQGCKATLTSEGSRLEGPSGEVMAVVRYGSLLFMCPRLVSLDPEDANFSAAFHAQFAVRPPPGLVAPTFRPTIQYHADKWVLDSANHTLTRLHKCVRTILFSPEGMKDKPIDVPAGWRRAIAPPLELWS